MKRIIILSAFLWLSLFLWSSNASAITVATVQEAWSQCQTRLASTSYEYAACFHYPDASIPYVHFANQSWNSPGPGVSYQYTAGCPSGEEFNTSSGQCEGPPPPECESPNYIDVVSGECVPPTEFCYTNLESQADECTLIGDEDQDGLNCVTDSSGLELCLGDNPLCHTANGETFCPEPDAVCGLKNGVYSCVDPAQEGCGYFNGEKVCFTPDGDQVDETSPDHPDNGGNLDGNDTNDPTDARDPTEGGDANNQPGESDTSSTDGAIEKTARDSLNKLRDIDKGVSGVKSAVEQGFSSLKEEGNAAEVEGIGQDIANTPIEGLQDLEDGIGTNPLDGDAADGLGNTVTGLVQQGTCTELGFNFNGHAFGLPCDKTQKIRDMLSWVLYFLTVWMLFDIVTSPVVRRA